MHLKPFLYLILSASCLLGLAACEPAEESEPENKAAPAEAPPAEEASPAEAASEPYVVDIVAADYAFSAPAEIPSGWITLRLNNQRATEIHEISLARLPDGVNYDTYLDEVISGWEVIWDGMRQGEIGPDQMEDAMGEHLPEWAPNITYLNARNLLSPGRISESIVKLEPGTYALECWVKNEEGDIHISHGMVHKLVVTEEDSGAPRPEGDVTLTLDGEGVEMDAPLKIGKQTVAVNVTATEDGSPVRNDVHLIRVTDDTDLAEVSTWLNWYDTERGLRDPAPADFLGGYHAYYTMPDEGQAWFTLNIDEPGEYAWIMEGAPEDEPWQLVEVE